MQRASERAGLRVAEYARQQGISHRAAQAAPWMTIQAYCLHFNPSWAAVSSFHFLSFRIRNRLSMTMQWVPLHNVCCALHEAVQLLAVSLLVGAGVVKLDASKISPLSSDLRGTASSREAVLRMVCSLGRSVLLM
jgi:hypothetical protein